MAETVSIEIVERAGSPSRSAPSVSQSGGVASGSAPSQTREERAAERAERIAERAAERATRLAERTAERAERLAEKAAERAAELARKQNEAVELATRQATEAFTQLQKTFQSQGLPGASYGEAALGKPTGLPSASTGGAATYGPREPDSFTRYSPGMAPPPTKEEVATQKAAEAAKEAAEEAALAAEEAAKQAKENAEWARNVFATFARVGPSAIGEFAGGSASGAAGLVGAGATVAGAVFKGLQPAVAGLQLAFDTLATVSNRAAANIRAEAAVQVAILKNDVAEARLRLLQQDAAQKERVPLIGGWLGSKAREEASIIEAMMAKQAENTNRIERVGKYSGPLSQAQAESQFRDQQRDIREATNLGPDYARLIAAQSAKKDEEAKLSEAQKQVGIRKDADREFMLAAMAKFVNSIENEAKQKEAAAALVKAQSDDTADLLKIMKEAGKDLKTMAQEIEKSKGNFDSVGQLWEVFRGDSGRRKNALDFGIASARQANRSGLPPFRVP